MEDVTPKANKKKKKEAAKNPKAKEKATEKKPKHHDHRFQVVVGVQCSESGESGESEGCLPHQGAAMTVVPSNSCG